MRPTLLALIPLFFLVIYTFTHMVDFKNETSNKKPFQNKWSNLFYNLSFEAPVKWLIDEKEEEVEKQINLIREADMEDTLNWRTYQSIRVSLLMIGFGVFLLSLIFMRPLLLIMPLLFGLPYTGHVSFLSTMLFSVIILFVGMCLPFFYTYKLKNKIKRRKSDFIENLPLLQLSIHLSLKSDATMDDILYSLSTSEGPYKEIFNVAYRKFLSSQKECFEYLKEQFEDTGVDETIHLLEGHSDYGKEDLVHSLWKNRKNVMQYTKNERTRKTGFIKILANGALFFPVVSLFIFIAVPVFFWMVDMIGGVF